jgi:hypothetical protein
VLDWVITNGVPHGGWCLKGPLAEDGGIPSRYQLTETPSKVITQRTDWNVRDSGGTVVFTVGSELGRGSRRTMDKANEFGKPRLFLSRAEGVQKAAKSLKLISTHGVKGSTWPGAGAWVKKVFEAAFPLVLQFQEEQG